MFNSGRIGKGADLLKGIKQWEVSFDLQKEDSSTTRLSNYQDLQNLFATENNKVLIQRLTKQSRGTNYQQTLHNTLLANSWTTEHRARRLLGKEYPFCKNKSTRLNNSHLKSRVETSRIKHNFHWQFQKDKKGLAESILFHCQKWI